MKGLGLHPSTLPLGVDIDTFNPGQRCLDLRRELGLADDTRLLVYAGRFSGEKNLPVLIEDPATGIFEPALGSRDRDLHLELLFSYQPRPGTVLFLGYNSQLADPGSPSRGLRRATDVFFVKLSYLFRL